MIDLSTSLQLYINKQISLQHAYFEFIVTTIINDSFNIFTQSKMKNIFNVVYKRVPINNMVMLDFMFCINQV